MCECSGCSFDYYSSPGSGFHLPSNPSITLRLFTDRPSRQASWHRMEPMAPAFEGPLAVGIEKKVEFLKSVTVRNLTSWYVFTTESSSKGHLTKSYGGISKFSKSMNLFCNGCSKPFGRASANRMEPTSRISQGKGPQKAPLSRPSSTCLSCEFHILSSCVLLSCLDCSFLLLQPNCRVKRAADVSSFLQHHLARTSGKASEPIFTYSASQMLQAPLLDLQCLQHHVGKNGPGLPRIIPEATDRRDVRKLCLTRTRISEKNPHGDSPDSENLTKIRASSDPSPKLPRSDSLAQCVDSSPQSLQASLSGAASAPVSAWASPSTEATSWLKLHPPSTPLRTSR